MFEKMVTADLELGKRYLAEWYKDNLGNKHYGKDGLIELEVKEKFSCFVCVNMLGSKRVWLYETDELNAIEIEEHEPSGPTED